MVYGVAKVVKQLFLGVVGLVFTGLVTWAVAVLILFVSGWILILAGGTAEILPEAMRSFGFRVTGAVLFTVASFLLGAKIVERMD